MICAKREKMSFFYWNADTYHTSHVFHRDFAYHLDSIESFLYFFVWLSVIGKFEVFIQIIEIGRNIQLAFFLVTETCPVSFKLIIIVFSTIGNIVIPVRIRKGKGRGWIHFIAQPGKDVVRISILIYDSVSKFRLHPGRSGSNKGIRPWVISVRFQMIIVKLISKFLLCRAAQGHGAIPGIECSI